jgi:hypothetical protein
MRKTKTLLLTMLATTILAVGALPFAGCGGDDTSGGTPTKDGGTDGQIALPDTYIPGQDSPSGETGTDSALATGQIDRIGRPAINTALSDTVNKDTYNKTSTFEPNPPADRITQFDTHLKYFDMLDGVNDWTPDGGLHPLAVPLGGLGWDRTTTSAIVTPFADYLLVDVTKPCGVNASAGPPPTGKGSFLAIELYILGLTQVPYNTCGGRELNDDVMDTFLNAGITKFRAGAPQNATSDCVNQATKLSTDTWPYLADPN